MKKISFIIISLLFLLNLVFINFSLAYESGAGGFPISSNDPSNDLSKNNGCLFTILIPDPKKKDEEGEPWDFCVTNSGFRSPGKLPIFNTIKCTEESKKCPSEEQPLGQCKTFKAKATCQFIYSGVTYYGFTQQLFGQKCTCSR